MSNPTSSIKCDKSGVFLPTELVDYIIKIKDDTIKREKQNSRIRIAKERNLNNLINYIGIYEDNFEFAEEGEDIMSFGKFTIEEIKNEK